MRLSHSPPLPRQPAYALACLSLCTFLAAAPASAHDMWLVPSTFEVSPGELVPVRLRLGHAGSAEVVVRDPGRILRFATVGLSSENLTEQPVLGRAGQDPSGYLRPRLGPETPALLAVVYESTPAFSELPAERFLPYLEEEGLEAVDQQRRDLGEAEIPGRELYSRSLKSLVVIGAGSEGQASAPLRDRPSGLPLELILESGLPMPAGAGDSAEPPREIRFRLLFRGEPLAGALVDAQPLAGSAPAETKAGSRPAGRTDAEGRVSLKLSPGPWLVTTVHSLREPEPEDQANAQGRPPASWRSYFASLTFSWGQP